MREGGRCKEEPASREGYLLAQSDRRGPTTAVIEGQSIYVGLEHVRYNVGGQNEQS